MPKPNIIAFETSIELSMQAGLRPLQKHEILLHAQACRTLQAYLLADEKRLEAEEQHDSNRTA